MSDHTVFDWDRADRTGVPEAIFAEGKTPAQIAETLVEADRRAQPVLLTRLGPEAAQALADMGHPLTHHPTARIAIFGAPPSPPEAAPNVGIVTAGTSDMSVAEEAALSARFFGLNTTLYPDCGVAGLWRLMNHREALQTHPLLIAVAGMEGALFSVLAGLVTAPVIAVPSAVGYGVSADGRLALNAALGGCVPGVLTVNIDNGFGAAAAARKILRPQGMSQTPQPQQVIPP